MTAALKEAAPAGRVLTGRMVLVLLLGFFAVVFGANAIMARYAYKTFRGVASAHAYTDGLAYNNEIQAAHDQDALGWQVKGGVTRIAPGRSRIIVSQVNAQGVAGADIVAQVQFEHPVDRARDKALVLSMDQPGVHSGEIEIEPGQWGLTLRMSKNGQTIFQSQNRVEITDRK